MDQYIKNLLKELLAKGSVGFKYNNEEMKSIPKNNRKFFEDILNKIVELCLDNDITDDISGIYIFLAKYRTFSSIFAELDYNGDLWLRYGDNHLGNIEVLRYEKINKDLKNYWT